MWGGILSWRFGSAFVPVGAGVDEAWSGDACVALVLLPQVFPFLPGRRKRPHSTQPFPRPYETTPLPSSFHKNLPKKAGEVRKGVGTLASLMHT